MTTLADYDLTLYYYDGCFFCSKVKRFMDKNDISINMKNIMTDPEARAELVSTGGRSTVPCLFINNEPMYESDDIIEWMQEHL